MLHLRANVDLTFNYSDFEYFKSLRSSKIKNNKSNIIVIDYGNLLHNEITTRDVYKNAELKTDMVDKAVSAMKLKYFRFVLVYCSDAGNKVLAHRHKSIYFSENHYQPVIGLTPSQKIFGLQIEDQKFDLINQNHLLLNVKLNHSVDSQNEPVMWITTFGGVI